MIILVTMWMVVSLVVFLPLYATASPNPQGLADMTIVSRYSSSLLWLTFVAAFVMWTITASAVPGQLLGVQQKIIRNPQYTDPNLHTVCQLA